MLEATAEMDDKKHWKTNIMHIAWTYWCEADLETTASFIDKCLQTATRAVGEARRETFEAMIFTSLVYHAQGRTDEAQLMRIRVQQIWNRCYDAWRDLLGLMAAFNDLTEQEYTLASRQYFSADEIVNALMDPNYHIIPGPLTGQGDAKSGWWHCHLHQHLNNTEYSLDICTQCAHSRCILCRDA